MFYTMVINDTEELGILLGIMAEVLKSALEDLKWYSLEAWFDIHGTQLLSFCPTLAVEPLATFEENVGSNDTPSFSSSLLSF